jgi:hypothetical protein
MLNAVKHLAQITENLWLDMHPLTPAEILRFTQDDESANVMLNAVKHLAGLPEHLWVDRHTSIPAEILRIRSHRPGVLPGG